MNANAPFDWEASLEREQQRAAELAYLYQFALDLMSHTDTPLSITCETVAETMLILLNCESAVILLRDEQNGDLAIAASRGSDHAWFWTFCEQIFGQRRALVNSGSAGSALGVTLFAGDEPLGVLAAYRGTDNVPFNDHEIQLITLLAGVTATIVINARLRDHLNERLNLLQTVMEGSPAGLAVIERSTLLMANPAALHALHLDSAAFNCPLTINGPDGLLSERLMEAMPPSRATTFDYRVQTEHRPRILRIDVVPVGTEKLLAQINDITLLREIELRREAAVASTSHELKTPLAVMNLGLSSLLSYYEQMPDEDRRTMIEETLEQVGEMKMLISSLLDQSQRSKRTTKEISSPETVDDPAFYIGQVVNELLAFARYHGVMLHWRTPMGTLPGLHCAVTDLKTIIRNLITNAIKYTPRDGDVIIESAGDCENDLFWISVHDTGVGIPAGELDAIFEASFRASTHGSAEGTGIGLSLVRDIVTRLGGSISVQSELEVGSVFTVALPCTLLGSSNSND